MSKRSMTKGWLVVLALAGCAEAKKSAPAPEPPAPQVFSDPAPPATHAVGIEPLGDVREGSRVVLARVAGTAVAWVADEDERAIHTLDLESGRELARTQVDGRPGRMLVLPGDRLAVTLRDAASVAILAAEGAARPLRARAAIATEDEPIALALPKERDALWVATGWGRTIGSHAIDDFRALSWRRVGREPRAIAISEEGEPVVAYMSENHLTVGERAMQLVKPTFPTIVARQAFAIARVGKKVVVPYARVFPGDPRATSTGYGQLQGAAAPPVEFAVAAYDPALAGAASEGKPSKAKCMLPRDAVTAGDRVLVACTGSDTLAEVDADGTVVRTTNVAGGPEAIAWDPMHRRAYVLAALDRALVVVAADGTVTKHPLSHRQGFGLSALASEGRKLFHRATDARISGDGRACASCHPDGRDDGLVWSTPGGPRQTLFLAGRLRRDVGFGWEAKHASIAVHVRSTVHNLQGTGLPDADLEKIAAYCVAMSPPPRKERALTPEEEHGRALFLSDKTACSTCHVDTTLFTDSSAHDIGSAFPTDDTTKFLAPPLRYLAGTGPFFHDGRYASLGDLLRGTRSTMGSTQDLSDAELRDLEAYLRTL